MRERVAGIALCAYPSAARAAHGEEMLGTLLDASAGSRSRFLREIVDLVRRGLRTRATQTAGAGARRLVTDGLCLGATWVMTLDLGTLLSQRARGMHDPLLASASIALLAVILALALIGYDRVAGAGALVWSMLRVPALWDHHPGIVNLIPEVVPIICFGVMVLAPRRRGSDPRRLAWLLVPATLVLTFGPPSDEQSPLLLAYVALAAVSVAVFAIAILPTDPRLAIAVAVSVSTVGLAVAAVNHDTSAPAYLAVAAVPAVLAIAITRTRRLQQRPVRI
jgi:hypothetical protein